MRIGLVLFVALLPIGLGACDREAPQAAALRRGPDPKEHARELVRREIGQKLRDATRRFDQPFEVDEALDRTRCPDETLPSGDAATNLLVVRVHDARAERRELLPLRLRSSLESDEFSSVVGHLKGGAAALWDGERAEPRSDVEAELALAELGRLEQRRYRAELVVGAYSAPKLFRRKDAPRSEWSAGALAGRLVIGEIASGRVLCQVPLQVRGDADAAPVTRRLREATRDKLEIELADRAWSAMATALSSISSVLCWPPNDRRADPAQRWARPTADPRVARVKRVPDFGL